MLKNKRNLLAVTLVIANAEGFMTSNNGRQHAFAPAVSIAPRAFASTTGHKMKRNYASASSLHAATQTNDEVEKLQAMAAKLREEVATLETERQQAAAEATEREFKRLDIDMNGEITLEELKAGLEKVFKMKVPESRIEQLMTDLDASGDGALQLEEFVGVDRIRNQIDANLRSEKDAERQAQKAAREEQEASERAEAQAAIVNDDPPTVADKALSVVPYVFPVLDSLQYARFLVLAHPNNPLSIAASALFGAYQAVPFAGLLAFFSLIVLSGNPQINKLVRFNMVQAAYLDTVMFAPTALVGLVAAAAQLTGNAIPPVVGELATDATFFAVLAAAAYSSLNSLVLGEIPNKLPFLSKIVERRQLTPEEFDESGRYIGPPGMRDDDNETKNDQDEQ